MSSRKDVLLPDSWALVMVSETIKRMKVLRLSGSSSRRERERERDIGRHGRLSKLWSLLG